MITYTVEQIREAQEILETVLVVEGYARGTEKCTVDGVVTDILNILAGKLSIQDDKIVFSHPIVY